MLGDLLAALAIRSPTDRVLDPTCGSGTVLLRAARRLVRLGRSPAAAVGQLAGFDVDARAVDLAKRNLARVAALAGGGDPSAPGPQLAPADLQEIAPGASPPYDAVVGNLPYVRLHRRGGQGANPRRTGLSGHADLYAALFVRLHGFVRPGGRIALLTSSAYLQAAYGAALRRHLLERYRVLAVIESRSEPWFAGAGVNTVITVVERAPAEGHAVRFVTALGSWVHGSPRDAPEVEALAGAALGSGDGDSRDADRDPSDEAAEVVRVRAVGQDTLLAGETGADHPGAAAPLSWSTRLRAPDVYHQLLEHGGLRPAGDLLAIRRGVTTNWNPFFYLDADAARARGIEPRYLEPVLRSPKEARAIAVTADDLPGRVFVCPDPEDALAGAGHHGALGWLAAGRAMTNRRGRPIPEALNHRPWYALRPERFRLFFTKASDRVHLHRLSDRPLVCDQRLYGLEPRAPGTDPALVAAVLNSSVVALSAELAGHTSLGEGALDLPVHAVQRQLLVPDFTRFGDAARRELTARLAALAGRPVDPLDTELPREDRRALDRAVLDALGLDPARFLPAIHDAVRQLCAERLGLAEARRAVRRRG